MFALLRKLSLGFQQERHDPVKGIHQIQKFAWAMAKLQILIENDLSPLDCNFTFYKQLLKSIKTKDNTVLYQRIDFSFGNVNS